MRESPRSVWLWLPRPPAPPPGVPAWGLVFVLLLRSFFFLCRASTAESSDFQPRYMNVELIRSADLLFQSFKRGSCKFDNCSAPKTGKMKVVLPRPSFVIMLLTVQVHQIEFVNHAQFLQQLDGPIYGRAIDVWFFSSGQLQQAFGIKMRGCLLNGLDQDAPLSRQPYSSGSHLIQQFMTRKQWQHL